MKELDWHGLYGEGWQNEIVGEAFSHPAKFSRALIRRIYEHALGRGWLKEGDAVLDPFAGVALGGLDAMFHGLHWVGVELEGKFVGLGQQNIDLWNSRYNNGMLPRWGTAVILQGDSRDLLDVLGGALRPGSGQARAQACVSSPPYADAANMGVGGIDWEKAGRPDRLRTSRKRYGVQGVNELNYGTNPRNLGNMREGDHEEAVRAVVSSPPYATGDVQQSHGQSWREELDTDAGSWRNLGVKYGDHPGQLGAMKEGDVDAVISSPPYAASATKGARENRVANLEQAGIDSKKWLGKRRCTQGRSEGYGQSPGQLAAMPEGAFEAQAEAERYYPTKRLSNDNLHSHQKMFALRERISPTYNINQRPEVLQSQVPKTSVQAISGSPQAVISSPPIMSSDSRDPSSAVAHNFRGNQRYSEESPTDGRIGGDRKSQTAMRMQARRAQKVANLGNIVVQGNSRLINTDTFWTAARQIVRQCWLALAPGGVAIFVLKDFIRDKKRVPFCDQWRRMCESVGFESVEWVRAWLVEDRGAQWALDGELVEKRVERKSFFRRLHEKKYPELSIDFEVVLVMRKAEAI